MVPINFYQTVKEELKQYADKEKAEFMPKFFKTNPGDYGAGDVFIGVSVPNQRKVAIEKFEEDLRQQFLKGLV